MTAAAVRLRRLFFALWPDEATRAALHRETRSVVRHCGGKPVTPANLHLTLAFLGNVPDERLPAVTAAPEALQMAPFALTLDRYGWFEAAQVLWIGCVEPPAPLRRLAAELGHLMAEVAELQTDLRPFHPHLTLARKVRNPPELKPPRPVAWAIGGFALVESTTDPEGARYEVISTFQAQ
jgi:2'-5' RNA ligase